MTRHAFIIKRQLSSTLNAAIDDFFLLSGLSVCLLSCGRTTPPQHPLDMSATCPTAYLTVDERSCANLPDTYGLSAEDPLRWGMGGTEPLWHGRLECADGTEPTVFQIPQSATSPATDSPTSELSMVRGESELLDMWSVRCGEDVQTWYVDLYHCGNPCPPRGASLIEADAFALYKNSMELLQMGQGVGAIGAMTQAVSLDPDNQGLWVWLGTLQLAAERYEDALVSFDRASTFAPDDLSLQLRTSIALYELGRLDEYMALLESAMEVMHESDPRQPELYCRGADALQQLERGDEANLWAARACNMGFYPCCGGPVPPSN